MISSSLSRAVTRWSALVSGRCSLLVLYARPTRRDLSPTWVFQSCEIRNPKRKKIIIRKNNARSHAQPITYIHTRSNIFVHTHRRTYCYTWFFFKSGLRPAGRPPPPPPQSFAAVHCTAYIYTLYYYGLLWREKKMKQ